MSDHDDLPALDDHELAMLAAFQAEEHPPAASVERVRARVLASTTAAPTGTVIRGPWVAAVAIVAAAAAALLLIDFGGEDATAVNRHRVQQAADTPELAEGGQVIAKEAAEPRQSTQRPTPAPTTTAPVDTPPLTTSRSPPPRKPAVAKTRPTIQPELEPTEPVSSLAAETRLLDRARKAVAGGHPGQALSILRDAESQFPQGVLRQERAALRVVALCDAGQTEAGRAAAASFTKAHPRSALRARVEGACPSE